MKRICIAIIFTLALGFVSQIVLSQDTVYLSNLGEASGGGVAVNNDSVIRAPFTTGSNSGGYILDSVQLVMNAASGDPTDFNVAIYGLGSLTGSANPFNAGVFTYIASGITLQADTTYYVAVISRQSSINGDYYWRNYPLDIRDGFGVYLGHEKER